MANYFRIKNEGHEKIYEYKTTHTGRPYLPVNKTGFLDLTTKTTTGIQIKVKQNNQIYRPLQSATTSTSSSKEYTSTQYFTTGYSGRTSSNNTTATGYRSTSYTYRGTRTTATSYSGSSCVQWRNQAHPTETVTERSRICYFKCLS